MAIVEEAIQAGSLYLVEIFDPDGPGDLNYQRMGTDESMMVAPRPLPTTAAEEVTAVLLDHPMAKRLQREAGL